MWLGFLFAMNQAHGHLPTWAEKVITYGNLGGRFLDALWDGILEHVWHPFGSIVERFGRQYGKKNDPKIDSKKGPKKVMLVSAVVCGNRAARPYTSTLRAASARPGRLCEALVTPYDHSTSCLGGTVADYQPYFIYISEM